jgi:A/G-specific adenine glycosylase
MDLGATVCTPRGPACGVCPWEGACAGRRLGVAAGLPRRAAKPAKPVRRGAAWLALRADGCVLVEARPPSGLLGGMLALPSGAWGETPPQARPPFAAAWRDLGEVRHSFTHFHLVLRLQGARLPAGACAPVGAWRPAGLVAAELPSVMRKALRLGLAALQPEPPG